MLLLIAMAYAGVHAGIAFGFRHTGGSTTDTVSRFLTVLLLDNRAFAMFAILYGYGMGWMVGRQLAAGASERMARRTLLRRSAFLVLLGAVHALVVFPGEILASYGVAGLAVGWLLFRSERTLTRTIAVLIPVYCVTVTAAMIATSTGTEAERRGAWAQPGYLEVEDWLVRLGLLPVNPLYIAIVFPLLLLVTTGMWASRHRLLDEPDRNRVLLRRIAIGGTAISVAGAVPAALMTVGIIRAGPIHEGLILALQTLTGVLGGAGYLALFALLGARLQERRNPLIRAVAATGRRSLTCYLFNSVLVTIILHPDLLGVGAHVSSFGAISVAFAAWLTGTCVAGWMEHTGRTGPAELLLRRLVHRRTTAD
ncbi:DUF418 domain-containing protein [Amycolatopsis sp. cmx-11-12]|uniref:DUF418 domain-containing protein n=1 Tax=Amycolatopsis sp. cmx-11-12 TaxID=2785795 RepID=UPI003917D44F